MLLKIGLFLLLATLCQGKGDLYCDFKKDLCTWSNLYGCHFEQETKTPLAGRTGYLRISKNTCNLAAISVSMKKEDPRFGFYYFLNGTGRADIHVYGVFAFSGRKVLWQCDASQGPKWNMAEILVNPSFFNPLKQIIIEVNILDDVTVAIGRIESPKHGGSDSRCPPSPPIVKPTTTTKPITKKATKGPLKSRSTPALPGSHTLCSFEFNLCQWKDIDNKCHFRHVKDTPLFGETGYLMLSKDTCKRAILSVRLKEFEFQFHYLMTGTGNMSLTVGVQYGFAGRNPLWSCSSSQGPKWNRVDLNVNLIHFDPVVNVYIDAAVNGDAVVAIGNIAKAGDGSKENKCPSKPRSLTTAHKPARRETTFQIHSKIATKPAVRIVTTAKPTPKIDSKLTLPPISEVINEQPASNAIHEGFLPRGVSPQGSKSKSGALVGGSVAGAIFVLVALVLGIFVYRRRGRMSNVQGSTYQIESLDTGFDNPLYMTVS